MKKANMMAMMAAASVFFGAGELRADDAKHAAEGKGFGTGAVVGALVGGPVGAAIGAGVGAQEEYRAHLGHEQLTAFVLTLREVRYEEG